MSEEIDRRIAIEVFGEEEPKAGTWHQNEYGINVCSFVSAENWVVASRWHDDGTLVGEFDDYEWQPLPFSSSLEEALRAWDKYVSEFREKRGFSPELVMSYQPATEVPFKAGTRHLDEFGRGGLLLPEGDSLPTAICNLLLALKEEK